MVPKYSTTIPPHMSSANHISLKQLTYKLMMLMLLTTGWRGQTLIVCRVDHMDLRISRAVLWLSTTLKTSKPNFHQAPFEIKAFPGDKRICPFTCLKEYLRQTVKLHQTKQLFIQLWQPHKATSRDMLLRWTCMVLTLARVDTSVF